MSRQRNLEAEITAIRKIEHNKTVTPATHSSNLRVSAIRSIPRLCASAVPDVRLGGKVCWLPEHLRQVRHPRLLSLPVVRLRFSNDCVHGPNRTDSVPLVFRGLWRQTIRRASVVLWALVCDCWQSRVTGLLLPDQGGWNGDVHCRGGARISQCHEFAWVTPQGWTCRSIALRSAEMTCVVEHGSAS